MQKPKVSILMTVYNHQKYIFQSIKSILDQNFKNFEFIIIDNGSTDKSKTIVQKFKSKKIRFFKLKKNIGRTNCLNYGLKKCRGEFIAIQDSDDISKKNRILFQLNYLKKNPKVGLVGSNFNVIDRKGKILKKTTIDLNLINDPRAIIHSNIIGHSTVMYRKNLIKFTRGYPKQFLYAQDYAFYLKIFTKYNIKLINKNLVLIRQSHSDSESARVSKTYLIQKEAINLIFWTLKNIETSLYEKIKILKKFILIVIKIILKIN